MNTNNRNESICNDWLNDCFPMNNCPYCGEDYDVIFDREEDPGTEVIYWATCGRCGKSWGQAFHLEFDYNFEE